MSQIAAQPWQSLLVNLIALITDRIAIVILSAALGMLVARAISRNQVRWLGMATPEVNV